MTLHVGTDVMYFPRRQPIIKAILTSLQNFRSQTQCIHRPRTTRRIKIQRPRAIVEHYWCAQVRKPFATGYIGNPFVGRARGPLAAGAEPRATQRSGGNAKGGNRVLTFPFADCWPASCRDVLHCCNSRCSNCQMEEVASLKFRSGLAPGWILERSRSFGATNYSW